MILPMSPRELASATDEEIIQAYASFGVDRQGAEAYLAVLRNPSPELIVD